MISIPLNKQAKPSAKPREEDAKIDIVEEVECLLERCDGKYSIPSAEQATQYKI